MDDIWGYPYFRKPPFTIEMGLNKSEHLQIPETIPPSFWGLSDPVGSSLEKLFHFFFELSSHFATLALRPARFLAEEGMEQGVEMRGAPLRFQILKHDGTLNLGKDSDQAILQPF